MLEEEATLKISRVWGVPVPLASTTKVAAGVVEPMPTEPAEVTLRMETPEEEARLKMSLVPAVPWMLKPMLVEVAFMPSTLPLSKRAPLVREVVPFQMATLPKVPEPVMVPLLMVAMVITPGVVVVMVMLAPAAKLAGWYLVPVPSAANSWPVTVGATEVAVPPLPTPKTPETSEPERTMAPLNRAPVDKERTGRAEFKEDRVVEPLEATCR